MEESQELQQMRQADKLLKRLIFIQEKLDYENICYDEDVGKVLTDEQKTGVTTALQVEKQAIVSGLVQMMEAYQQLLNQGDGNVGQ